jgi:hypothetical protein
MTASQAPQGQQLQQQNNALPGSGAAQKKAKDLENQNKKSFFDNIAVNQILKYYLAPLLLIAFSIGIVIVVILPLLDGLVSNIDAINQTQSQYEELDDKRQAIQSLSAVTNTQQEMLTKIHSIIPESQTEVANFSEKIRQKAEANRVEMLDSIVAEQVTISTGQKKDIGLELVELPAEFTVSGRLEGIEQFLSSIYGSEDFIIIKKMDLQKQTGIDESTDEATRFSDRTSDEWIMSLILVKYQFRLQEGVDDESIDQVYFNVPEATRPDQDVLDFINENY